MAAKIMLRALNRATLDRQLLLSRSTMPMLEALEQLVGLQAQTTHTWYHGLWSRLEDFQPERLSDLLANREVVRMVLMRSTIHLVTARDCLALRPLLQVVSERGMAANYGKNLDGLAPTELIALGRKLLAEKPMAFSELGKRMAEYWPDRDPSSLAHAVRAWVPLVQVPPRGLWGGSGLAAHSPVETWLGKPVDAEPSMDDMILRYLGAFGPAGVQDAQIWSGLTRLAEVFERLRPQLVTFTDEDRRELFDLPDAPRPDGETPAPPRFLYDFDNLLLSHQDRSRVITDEWRARPRPINGMLPKIFLVDGFTRGEWNVDQGVLTVQPFRRLSKKDSSAVAKEGARLLDFVAPGAETRDIRIIGD